MPISGYSDAEGNVADYCENPRAAVRRVIANSGFPAWGNSAESFRGCYGAKNALLVVRRCRIQPERFDALHTCRFDVNYTYVRRETDKTYIGC